MKFAFTHRIVLGLSIMTFLLILVGYFASITTKNLQKVSDAIMKENVSSLKAAEELELALLNQKGLVASYFLDGNLSWLKTLEERKKDFEEWFRKASGVALSATEKAILQDISGLYKSYDSQRNRAIRLYQAERIAEAKYILLNEMRKSTDAAYQKCEDLILANELLIAKAEASSRKNVAGMISLIWMTIITTLCLGGFMGFIFAKKMNEQLIRSAKMATLGQLSANIAHEIRNPLTSIKMRLYTLEEQLRHNPSTKEDMGIISEEINRMEKTVKNFLDFTRLPEPDLKICNINQLLEGTINLLSPKASFQNIQIKKNFDAFLFESNVDKEQMRQVFLNIMLNAIEAMPKGGVLEINMDKTEDKKNKSALEIKIKDSGAGMSAESRKRLFEPFFTTKTEGTGLGLFTASKIVQMHKGAIAVEAQPGKGTTFTVKLPLRP